MSFSSPSLTADERLRVYARAFSFPPGADVARAKSELSSVNGEALVQATKRGALDNPALFGMLAAQTLLAESSGSALARKKEIDFLLRVAGTTQIREAIEEAGAREEEGFVVVVAGVHELKVPPRYEGDELPERRLSNEELMKVERAALLSVEKA